MAAPPGKVLPFKNARPPRSIRPTRPTISASHKPPVGVQDGDMEEYPSTSKTILGLTLRERSKVAQACRRPWKRVRSGRSGA